jgi:glycosyltransferase involved in cell wall biosynthesis
MAIPALNEARRISACLTALLEQQPAALSGKLRIVIIANNCTDGTAEVIRARFAECPVEVREISLLGANRPAKRSRRFIKAS